MATGKWFAQIYPAGREMPEEPVYFPDFAATFAFVSEVKKRAPEDIVSVHTSAEATDQERLELEQNPINLYRIRRH